ncbi:unnamed protein product [Amoebophrya sp. A120]|nr:unnamed protein product [Amoebophrya sp. A120]|eukprot:GSA120T00019490001.1
MSVVFERGLVPRSPTSFRLLTSRAPVALLTVMFFLSAFNTLLTSALPCENDHSQVTQLSVKVKGCTCCDEPEEFLNKHERAYLLFYSGAHPNLMNAKIYQQYTEFARQWRYTNIAFGMVDIDMEKEFSEKWLEPNQVPTNILFQNFGDPVVIDTEDFKKALSLYQGAPEGHKFLLSKYYGANNIHFAKVLESKEQLETKFFGMKKSGTTAMAGKIRVIGLFPERKKDDDQLILSYRQAVWNAKEKLAKEKNLKKKKLQAMFSMTSSVDISRLFFAQKVKLKAKQADVGQLAAALDLVSEFSLDDESGVETSKASTTGSTSDSVAVGVDKKYETGRIFVVQFLEDQVGEKDVAPKWEVVAEKRFTSKEAEDKGMEKFFDTHLLTAFAGGESGATTGKAKSTKKKKKSEL